MSNVRQFLESFNAPLRESDRGLCASEEARQALEKIFGKYPDGLDDGGRPLQSFRLPEFTTSEGVRILLGRTNYGFDYSGIFNISVVDNNDVFHAYAQIRAGDKRIMYWTEGTSRRPGTVGQDVELLSILEQADRQLLGSSLQTITPPE